MFEVFDEVRSTCNLEGEEMEAETSGEAGDRRGEDTCSTTCGSSGVGDGGS